jgi:uncharacterized protein (TIRG00374 family)
MKWLRWLGIALGIGLVVLLVHEADGEAVADTLRWLGWKYVFVLVYPLTWTILNTLGWKNAFHPETAKIPLGRLISIRLAGETFNSLLPSSYVGGEPIKAKLISRWTTLREATSSVLIAKAAQSVGLLVYIGLGLTIGLPPGATTTQRTQAWVALGLFSFGVGTFVVLLANQSFARVGRALHRLTGWAFLAAQEPRLTALDESLGKFYRDCKGRFGASILWHSAGWIAGMLELVLIFWLAGKPISLRQAWFMGALAQLGAIIGLISPGGLGFYEGGHYMAAVLLGLPPALGLSASLIRRIREIFWNVIGLFFFAKYSKQETSSNLPN